MTRAGVGRGKAGNGGYPAVRHGVYSVDCPQPWCGAVAGRRCNTVLPSTTRVSKSPHQARRAVYRAGNCGTCGGQGRVSGTCQSCGGSGKRNGNTCAVCSGRGTVSVICATCKGSGRR